MSNASAHTEALARRIEANAAHAPCPICGAAVKIGKREGIRNFIKRQTCSQKCGYKMTALRNTGRQSKKKIRVRKTWTPPVGWQEPMKMATVKNRRTAY